MPRSFAAAIGIGAVICLAQFPATARAQRDTLAAFNDELQQVAAKVAPAVVQIDYIGLPSSDAESGDSSEGTELRLQRFTGSGVIVDSSGYVLTNAHIVRGATKLTVTLDKRALPSPESQTSREVIPARLIGEFEEADLAVLKIDMEGLPAVSFSRTGPLKQGQLVIAFGSPQGLHNSVSIGVVSFVDRQLSPDGHIAYIQTDAAINPGSSGGPLVDINGNLVGINSMLVSEAGGSEGLGFAIPSRLVEFAYDRIRDSGTVVWGNIGVTVQGITPALAAGLQLSSGSGVVVSDVAPGLFTDARAIRPGDIVISIDGEALESVPQYYEAMYQKEKGQKVTLIIRRGSTLSRIELPVTDDASSSGTSANGLVAATNLIPKLGILCSELKSKGDAPNSRSRHGVLVEAKAATSDLSNSLVAGDVIRSINRTAISSVAQLRSLIDGAKPGDPIVLQVERQGHLFFLSAETN